MDYYLISDGPQRILVEEFVLSEDHTAAGIDSAAWSPGGGSWSASPALSRELRSDARLRARTTPVDRRSAAEAYARLGGGELPDEQRLRALFRQRQPLPAAAPLNLGASPDTRRYRILFAGDFGPDGLANARAALRLEPTGDPRVVGRSSGGGFAWELRRIGAGIAWCVDVIAHLEAAPAAALGALLEHHRQAIREQGLIPVTIERFA
ncbi:hypothetical protein [Nonomuraea sp. NPDC049695]|uniref:hypothetical protein n=1 Tax=Nonomuraea sp. NPDC049695 TaxID=3154734 RepID=UPI003424EE53